MNSPASVNAKMELLQTLHEPSNFNNWLIGTHYSGDYIPHLERIARLEHAAVQVSATPAAATARRSIVRATPQHDTVGGGGKRDGVVACAHNAGKAVAADGTQVSLETASDTVGQGRQASSNAVDVMRRGKRHGRVRPSRQTVLEKKTRTTDQLSAIGGTATLGSQGLNAAEVRQQLQISYERMKQVDGFGQTFPALLTPMRRPVFHYYREDEWAELTHRRGVRLPFDVASRRSQDVAAGPSASGQRQGTARAIPSPPQVTLSHGSSRRAPAPPSGPPAFHATLTNRMCRTF